MRKLLNEVRKRLRVPPWEDTAANWLTLIRMQFGALSVFIAIAIGQWGLAFGLFVLFVFTDFLDGQWARLMGEKSLWGAYCDPAADKLFIDPLLVVGWIYRGHPLFFLIPLCIIGAYDVMVMLARSSDGGMKTMFVAKVKQVCLFLAVGILIAKEGGIVGDFDPNTVEWWGEAVLWAASALTVVSFMVYARQKARQKASRPTLTVVRRPSQAA